MSSTTTARRIDHLRRLIAGATTPEEERDTAQRLLARYLARAAREDASGDTPLRDRRRYGAKYHLGRGLTLTGIAKLIRADIKLARQHAKKHPATPGDIQVPDPIGDAPAGVKFGVRTKYYSGGGSIDIYVRNIPEEWGWTTVSDRWGDDRRAPSGALTALAKELKAVSDAYNHNGSDTTVDYFDVRFYGNVMNEDGLILA